MNNPSVLYVDTETTGLREEDRCFMITTVYNGNSKLYDLRKADDITEFKELYQSCEVRFQNAKFDMKMIYNTLGLSPKSVSDLMVVSRLRRNDHISYSLASNAKRHGLEKLETVEEYIQKNKLYSVYKDEHREVKLKHFDKVPDEVLRPYALTDVEITAKMFEEELANLEPMSLALLTMENKLTETCFWMERVGVKIDTNYCRKAIEFEKKKIREGNRKFTLYTGKIFDNSKSQLIEVFEKEGLVIPMTEKNNPMLDADTLDGFNSPIANAVKDIRKAEKKIVTYYSAFLYHMDHDAIVHPDMQQAGTATGRFSYREPNFQNMPKEEDSTEECVVRGCIVPRKDILVSIDYSQCEYRIMLDYAGEHAMIRKILDGEDVHQATADLLGISRKFAKTINFSILFGSGIDNLALMLGVSTREASALREKYFAKLPKVQKLIQSIISTGKSRGSVYNFAGRVLNINHRDFAYKLPNHLIQSSAADVCKIAMVDIHERLGKPRFTPMILQVHDALVFDINQDEKYIIDIAKECMENAYQPRNGMTLSVDITYSTESLAERGMKKWELS